MKLETLELNNFMAFRSCTIAFDDVTALIGANGSGKSTVLAALRWVLSDDLGLTPWDIWTRRGEDFDSREYVDDGPVFAVATFGELSQEETDTFGWAARDGKLRLGRYTAEIQDLGTSGRCFVLGITGKTDISEGRDRFGDDYFEHEGMAFLPLRAAPKWMLPGAAALPSVAVLPGPTDIAPDFEALLRPLFVEHIRQALGEELEAIVDRISELADDAEVAVAEKLSAIAPAYLGANARLVAGQPFSLSERVLLSAVIEASGPMKLWISRAFGPAPVPWTASERSERSTPEGSFEISAAGSGAIRSAALAILELYLDPDLRERNGLTILLLEEPEAGLHALAQRRVAASIAQMRGRANLQAVVATHSPTVASSVVDSVRILQRGPDGTSTVLLPLAVREILGAVGATPADVLLADRFIVVEGRTELLVIPILGQLIGLPLDPTSTRLIQARGNEAAKHAARLADITYPGTEIRVLLDAGRGSEKERDRIRKAYGERIDVFLLPVSEIEAVYSADAVTRWMMASGGDPRIAARFRPHGNAKHSLEEATQAGLGRPYNVAIDGAAIAQHMKSSELSDDVRVVLEQVLG